MTRAGDKAPDFELLNQDGEPTTLAGLLADGPVVLFFYPAAMTSGCTKESCHFRDLAAEFAAAGAQRVGISMDTVEMQKQFSDANGFDYPLLADTEGTVADAFGVKRSGLMAKVTKVKRATFVIGQDGQVLEAITSETKMDVHADEALKVLAR